VKSGISQAHRLQVIGDRANVVKTGDRIGILGAQHAQTRGFSSYPCNVCTPGRPVGFRCAKQLMQIKVGPVANLLRHQATTTAQHTCDLVSRVFIMPAHHQIEGLAHEWQMSLARVPSRRIDFDHTHMERRQPVAGERYIRWIGAGPCLRPCRCRGIVVPDHRTRQPSETISAELQSGRRARRRERLRADDHRPTCKWPLAKCLTHTFRAGVEC
jgi:hypothetical protein